MPPHGGSIFRRFTHEWKTHGAGCPRAAKTSSPPPSAYADLAAGRGAAALAALVIGVWSLIAGYFILNPQPVLTLNGEKHEEISACSTTPTPAHAPTAAAPT